MYGESSPGLARQMPSRSALMVDSASVREAPAADGSTMGMEGECVRADVVIGDV